MALGGSWSGPGTGCLVSPGGRATLNLCSTQEEAVLPAGQGLGLESGAGLDFNTYLPLSWKSLLSALHTQPRLALKPGQWWWLGEGRWSEYQRALCKTGLDSGAT